MKIQALSKRDFDLKMVSMDLNDSNVESKDGHYFISINPSMIRDNDSFDSGDDNIYPHFKKDHRNVIRLFYDDVVQDMLSYKALDVEQANKVVEFVKGIKGSDATVLVHCTAGKSRSVATAYFVSEVFGINVSEVEAREDATPNKQVLNLLRECAK